VATGQTPTRVTDSRHRRPGVAADHRLRSQTLTVYHAEPGSRDEQALQILATIDPGA
jgi:hypothetical protein